MVDPRGVESHQDPASRLFQGYQPRSPTGRFEVGGSLVFQLG